ncbi:Serine/threonine-protein kinase PknH [Pseudobythopirellula maris]|uniref:Serine/threonine-protein kinase PknH n=1 Tax=Pseudobythopirellula maris TaxID=2527991 RepID=A0A5C5ZNU3_9BACT|nr:serine/threonine-protein kinase [Pseudobythopirellula maris]TWT88441.1 Serine/threonine-protein kinase PknH [Pseudobythopirellula maris]
MSTSKLRFLPTKTNFTLGKQIGSGTVGVVYRATSPELEEPVAIKLLLPSVSGDPKIVDRFEREIMIMERLNHPHIVRNYGGGVLDGQYFYAMQLLEHGSLKGRMAKGRIPWPQAAAYGVQIASALQHAHNHGIVHRDLKPSNLFFNQDGGLVLGDFGIARDSFATSDITQQGMTVGTYLYMSPEQITADARIDGKADLYSLGCVMYEMIAGQPPYQGSNFAQVWDQHLHKQPKSLRDRGVDCPAWLDDLVLHLLAKEPEARPFSARAVEGLMLQHLIDEFGEEGARALTKLDPNLSAGDDSEERQVRTWPLVVAAIIIAVLIAIGTQL